MRAATAALTVPSGQRQILEKLAGSQSAPHREVTRAKALLMAEQGLANTAIAAKLGVSPSSVVAWRKTFLAEGVVSSGRFIPVVAVSLLSPTRRSMRSLG